MSARRGKLLGVLFGTGVTLLLVELALQIMAYNLWSEIQAGESRDDGDGPVVLCVGDSMTHGLGASTPSESYPAQLQRRLRARDGRSWVVVNGGWPGRDSRSVLEFLPDQLARFRPGFVCILVGVNDQWTRAGRAATVTADPSFPIVWRTKRMIDLLLVGRLDRREQEAFLGHWHMDQFAVVFETGGLLLLGDTEFRWILRADKLIAIDESQEIEIRWEVRDGLLHLRGPTWEGEYVLARGPIENLSAVEKIKLAVLRRDWRTAIAQSKALDGDTVSILDQACARSGLVRSWAALGKPANSKKHLQWLVDSENKHSDESPERRAIGENLVVALRALHREDDAIETALRLIEHHPASLTSWDVILEHERDPAQLEKLLEVAAAKLPKGHSIRRLILVHRAMLARDRNPAAFLGGILCALLEGAEESHMLQLLQLNRSQLTEESLSTAIAAANPSPADEARMRRWFDMGRHDTEDTSTILAEHLARIVDACKNANARPLLLDYPFRDPGHLRIVDAVALDKKTERIQVRPRFAGALIEGEREDLFIKNDMHCNDAGYALMSEAVVEFLLR